MHNKLWMLLSVAVIAGCPDVPLRPDGSPGAEKCPPGAREAMEAFNLAPGNSVTVDVDADRTEAGPIVVFDGPIETMTWGPVEKLPERTRLYGRVWTGGPRVVIRYYKARLPDGKVIPFCAVVASDGPGLAKTPSRPGVVAVPSSTGMVFITGQFK